MLSIFIVKVVFFNISLPSASALILKNFTENPLTENLPSTQIAQSDITIKLIKPAFQKQLFTLTPTFVWHSLQTENTEYRILISEVNGRIIFDEWIKQDTTFSIPLHAPLSDLSAYYWMVYGYKNDQFFKSAIWSFWIDLNLITDLEIGQVNILNPRADWEAGDTLKLNVRLSNRGTRDASHCTLQLYSGELNENYFNNYAVRKTKLLNSFPIRLLKVDESKWFFISGVLTDGYNNIFVRIIPGDDLGEIFLPNNTNHVLKIQTDNRAIYLNGLTLIYPGYRDPEAGFKILNQTEIKQIIQNMIQVQNFYWENTLVLKIQTDTLIIDRILDDKNFTYQDDQWGYLLSADEILSDLDRYQIDETNYDFIFVNYSWWNSSTSWSGYKGYTFNKSKLRVPYSAQLLFKGEEIETQITIHEFIHLLNNLFNESEGNYSVSPHDRTLKTTFLNDTDFYKWYLQTTPTETWFHIRAREIVSGAKNMQPFLSQRFKNIGTNIQLHQNNPNPFSKFTTIFYVIPDQTNFLPELKISLTIFSLDGKQIKVIAEEFIKPGFFEKKWDGTDSNGKKVTRGIYIYELKVGDFKQRKKLIYF